MSCGWVEAMALAENFGVISFLETMLTRRKRRERMLQGRFRSMSTRIAPSRSSKFLEWHRACKVDAKSCKQLDATFRGMETEEERLSRDQEARDRRLVVLSDVLWSL